MTRAVLIDALGTLITFEPPGPHLREALRERHGVARVVIRRKEHYSKPATGELIDEMAQEVQVAIAAVGG